MKVGSLVRINFPYNQKLTTNHVGLIAQIGDDYCQVFFIAGGVKMVRFWKGNLIEIHS